jgi:predicted MFS family arabinose efflux permease
LRIVLGNPLLRSLAGCTATWNFFSNLLFAVFVLYVTGELGITPVTLGLVFSFGAPGALIGALIAGRVARRFGLGPTIVGSALIGGVSWLTVPLAGGSLPLVMAALIGGQFIGGMMGVIYNINQVSLRQVITPDRLQGRMNATMRFIVWGTIPIGSLVGGALGEAIGLWPTLMVGAAGEVLAFLWVLLSPVRRLREQPLPAQDAPVAAGSTLAT